MKNKLKLLPDKIGVGDKNLSKCLVSRFILQKSKKKKNVPNKNCLVFILNEQNVSLRKFVKAFSYRRMSVFLISHALPFNIKLISRLSGEGRGAKRALSREQIYLIIFSSMLLIRKKLIFVSEPKALFQSRSSSTCRSKEQLIYVKYRSPRKFVALRDFLINRVAIYFYLVYSCNFRVPLKLDIIGSLKKRSENTEIPLPLAYSNIS